MGKKRSQAEVDALWPKNKDQYKFTATVTLPNTATNKTEAATMIQQMFEGMEAMAGQFEVRKLIEKGKKNNLFVVVFERDVPDDTEVVNDELLKGRDFNKVLTDQFMQEAKAVIEDKKLPYKVKITSGPAFSKIKL